MLRTVCSTNLLNRNYFSLLPTLNLHSSIMTTKIIYNYHMSYLMDSKHDDRYVKIDRRAFHLYKDSLLNFPQQQFNEKIFLTILIDTVRTKQKYQDFEQLAQYGLKHINQFKQPLSIFNFATQLYLYNYPNKQKSYILGKKGFEFFRINSTLKYSSYYVMKFLIFLQKNVGLQRFTDEEYRLINFRRFKPLFLCFTLEMFYTNNLQHYKTIQYLFDLFTSSQSIIPFADIHHYKLATKRITDPRFKEFVDNLSKRLINQRDIDNSQMLNSNHKLRNIVDDGEEEDIISDLEIKQNGNKQNDIQQKKNSKKMIKKQDKIYPWQKAYSNHIYRQFTYYPSINYSHQQSSPKHNTKNN